MLKKIQIECKYFQSIVTSLTDLQSPERIPFQTLKNWYEGHLEAIYKTDYYYEEILYKNRLILLNNDIHTIANHYRELNFVMYKLKPFYNIGCKDLEYKKEVDRFKNCNEDIDLIRDWLFSNKKNYKEGLLFAADYSSVFYDFADGREYIYSSGYLDVVFGIETSAYSNFETFMTLYQDNLYNEKYKYDSDLHS